MGLQPHIRELWLGGEGQPREEDPSLHHSSILFPINIFQSLLLAGHSAKGGFTSIDASNHYPTDVLQVQCALQPVLTAARTLVPDIITDI